MTEATNPYQEYVIRSVDFIERIHRKDLDITPDSASLLADNTIAAMCAGYLYAWMSSKEIEEALTKAEEDSATFFRDISDEINMRGGKQ